jgi:septum formation protein
MISRAHPLLLASASPRRRELLERLRIPIAVSPIAAFEGILPQEPPGEYLSRVVQDKLALGRAAARTSPLAMPNDQRPQPACVLVADTIVVVDGEILGKPESPAGAATMLRKLAGRTHQVMTRYAFAHGPSCSRKRMRTVHSSVFMRPLTNEEIERYADAGEGLDKAGAYAIQGVGAHLVERIEGSYTNIMGLPLAELVRDLQAAGLLGPVPVEVH